MIAHASSAGTAKRLWEGKPADMPKPMAIEQYAPFANDYKFFDDMGVRVPARPRFRASTSRFTPPTRHPSTRNR